MQTLQELGKAIQERRRTLHLGQGLVAGQAGLRQDQLSRLERGQLTEFGSRKLLAVLAVLGIEIAFVEVGATGTLDELRRERSGS
ncbi:helix-turn-helix domain-containing protein [Occallatibacter savannae]|uniref:helix-turn-helix domain-containing protein n=1 Tax=Occallatibacter savannae TaxID=1002691 RepID=UPI000D68717F|nr:XRE family transcriptional regulator [Occallatibacter savannae]